MRRPVMPPGPNETGSRGVGYLVAVISAMGAGAATVAGKWNLEAISPLLMNSLIFSIATVLLSAWVIPAGTLRQTKELDRKGWFWLMAFTVSSWLAIWAYWSGVQLMDPTLAAFLNRSEVMIAILLGIIFLRERFTRIETLGAILSVAGIIVMRLTLRMEYSTGFWLVLLGSFFFGITEFISKIAVRHVPTLLLIYIRNGFLAIGYWVVFMASDGSFEGLARVWPGVLLLGFLGPILSRYAYLIALKRLELSKVAVISQSQPVWVIVIAMTLLGQLPTLREAVGGLLLTLGTIVMIAARRRPFGRKGPSTVPPTPDGPLSRPAR